MWSGQWRFAAIFFDRKQPLEQLQPILDAVAIAWREWPEEEREDFRSLLQKYIRAYGFLSQILTFRDSDLEKLYVFAQYLNKKLDRRTGSLPYDVVDAGDFESFRIQETFHGSLELEKRHAEIHATGDGGLTRPDHEQDYLSNIIQLLNETYGLTLTDEDKVDIELIKIKLESDDELCDVLTGDNTVGQIRKSV